MIPIHSSAFGLGWIRVHWFLMDYCLCGWVDPRVAASAAICSLHVMASRFSDHRSWAGCAVATVARALGFPGVAFIPPAAATVAWFDTAHYVSLVLVYPASSTKTDWGCASQCQEPEIILLMYPVLNWVVCNLFASYVNSWGRLKLSSCVREATAKYILLFFSFYLFPRSKPARLSNILFFVLCL